MTAPNVDSAVEIALAAGSLLRYYFERKVTFDLKAEYDLVTEADRASEKMVVDPNLTEKSWSTVGWVPASEKLTA